MKPFTGLGLHPTGYAPTSRVHRFKNPEPLNLEPRNGCQCESKRYLLPEESPFLKQKKSIPPSAIRQDGFFNVLIELKTPN
jgi:hypothetical protein